MSEVYFLPVGDRDGPYHVGEQVVRLFGRLRVEEHWDRRARIALKVQVGERGRPAPLPPAWLAPLEEHVPFFAQLDGALREHFLHDLKIFIWEKHFFAAGGMGVSGPLTSVESYDPSVDRWSPLPPIPGAWWRRRSVSGPWAGLAAVTRCRSWRSG